MVGGAGDAAVVQGMGDGMHEPYSGGGAAGGTDSEGYVRDASVDGAAYGGAADGGVGDALGVGVGDADDVVGDALVVSAARDAFSVWRGCCRWWHGCRCRW